jgi:uncharacterized protein (TIGR03545 family)
MQLDLRHISPQPQQVSQPLTLKLRISDMAQIQRLSAEGIFDHRTPKQSKDQLDFRFNGAQLNSLDIWQQYQLQLDSAVGEGEGQIQFNQQGWLLKLASDWQQARFHADRSEQAGRIIADSLSHISDFNLNASIKQVDDDRDINIDSNLDRRLNQALAKQWKIQQQQWLKRVKRGLVKQIEQQLAEGDTSMLELDKVVNALAQDEKQLDTLVKSELESLKDKQEKRVEKALQKKLDKLFD